MMGRGMRVAALLGLALFGCDDADDGGQGGVDGDLPGGAVCAFDDSTDRSTAVPLTAGEAVTGALCPVGDADWYRFDVGAGQRLLTVKLESTSPLTPVEPTYAVLAADGTPLGAPRPDEVRGTPLDITHCVPAGPVDVVVRDLGDDGQDLRHGYTLSVTAAADPDPAEPNDTAADAAALTVDAPVTGTIGCRGDVDVFRLTAPDRRVLRFRLQMPAGVVAPRVVVLGPGGETLTDQANPAGVREDTDLSRAVVLPAAGDYLVQVRDDDDGQADPAVEYTLSVALDEERDLNEPNDVAEQATVLSEDDVPCVEADWSGWFEVQGTVGVLGDRDWFRLPVSTCARGILEVEMAFDTAGLDADEQRALLAEVQASVAVVRAHAGSPCAADEECRELQQGCGSNWDCTGLFNTCLPSRRCAGASTCLPEGACGAFLVEKHVTPPTGAPVPGEAPLENRVRFSAPSLTNEPIYLVAGDFGGDGLAPDTFYTLRARVRRDPDRNEPSNLYTPTIRRDDPIGLQLSYAVRRGNVAPVHDCAGGRKGLPDAGVE
ncbi:MAG: hypothetical protein KC583_19640, partial [Myxococcales bacterium]|nr:hypothetical protein [Myxococcales bacterium]